MAPDHMTVWLTPYSAAGTLGTGAPCAGNRGTIIYEFGRRLCYACNENACRHIVDEKVAPLKREPRTGPKQHGEWWRR